MESSRGNHLGSPDATLLAGGREQSRKRENAQRVGLELLEVQLYGNAAGETLAHYGDSSLAKKRLHNRAI